MFQPVYDVKDKVLEQAEEIYSGFLKTNKYSIQQDYFLGEGICIDAEDRYARGARALSVHSPISFLVVRDNDDALDKFASQVRCAPYRGIYIQAFKTCLRAKSPMQGGRFSLSPATIDIDVSLNDFMSALRFELDKQIAIHSIREEDPNTEMLFQMEGR